jgi:hypothetical protein
MAQTRFPRRRLRSRSFCVRVVEEDRYHCRGCQCGDAERDGDRKPVDGVVVTIVHSTNAVTPDTIVTAGRTF